MTAEAEEKDEAQAARQAMFAIFDTLPRPLRVAIWDAIGGVGNALIPIARDYVTLVSVGWTDRRAGEEIARRVRRWDDDKVRDLHREMITAGFGGSPHLKAGATILRDADSLPKRQERVPYEGCGPIPRRVHFSRRNTFRR